MELYLQHNQWSCLPTAFAMILGVLPKDIIDYCNHDGGEIVFDAPEPYCRRGFTIEEMKDFCVAYAYTPLHLIFDGICEYEGQLYKPDLGDRLTKYLGLTDAVFCGEIDGKQHAVAWNCEEQKIYDPVGMIYTIDRFKIVEYIGLF